MVTKRDQSKAMEFVQMMRNVTPAMGIRVSNNLFTCHGEYLKN